MTKKEFTDGWKHFCDCIDFGRSNLDAEAIRFMNEGIGKILQTFEQRDDLLSACERRKKVVVESEGNIVWDANYGDMQAAIAKTKP